MLTKGYSSVSQTVGRTPFAGAWRNARGPACDPREQVYVIFIDNGLINGEWGGAKYSLHDVAL